jgi:hypothetical protein
VIVLLVSGGIPKPSVNLRIVDFFVSAWQRVAYLNRRGSVPHVQHTVVTCMESIHKGSEDDDAISRYTPYTHREVRSIHQSKPSIPGTQTQGQRQGEGGDKARKRR